MTQSDDFIMHLVFPEQKKSNKQPERKHIETFISAHIKTEIEANMYLVIYLAKK